LFALKLLSLCLADPIYLRWEKHGVVLRGYEIIGYEIISDSKKSIYHHISHWLSFIH
jgi:hypothetical protein